MTTMLKATRFRIRPPAATTSGRPAPDQAAARPAALGSTAASARSELHPRLESLSEATTTPKRQAEAARETPAAAERTPALQVPAEAERATQADAVGPSRIAPQGRSGSAPRPPLAAAPSPGVAGPEVFDREVSGPGTSGAGVFAASAAPPSAAPPSAAPKTRPLSDDGFGPDPFPTARERQTEITPPQELSVDAEIEAIRREGLTGRQLRLARRMAEKHHLIVSSDLDAVRQLRRRGLDPSGRSSVLDIVTQGAAGPLPPPTPGSTAAGAVANLPQTVNPNLLPSVELRAEQNHISEIQRIQRDISKRRRRKILLLWARLGTFVLLPTMIAFYYFAHLATPMFATRSEFVIQQAESTGASGLGSLFSGTQFATSQDSIAVQGYLQSRDAMLRLDQELGFRAHFADPAIDPLQRLDDPGSIEAAHKIYQKYVKISYDPTEGIVKLEVSGPDPQLSAGWSRQLISYAEEQVNQLSERLRADQMTGSRESYAEAERKLLASQERVVHLQEQNKVLSSEVEITLLSSQITALETLLSQDRLALAQMLSNPTPNRARVEPVQRRIETLQGEIQLLRSRLTEDGSGGRSLAKIQSELMVAETDVQTRQLLLTQAAQQMETARIEANRKQRYLSVSVAPVAPDVASYPRVFENTAVALLVFAGLYLMIALTASILREQVSS